MARWQGNEFYADVRGEKVSLTAIGDTGHPGFEQIRPGAWSAAVALTDCEIFERVFTASLDGVPVRLLRHSGAQAHVLLLSDDPADAQRLGAGLVEPGVYEMTVDTTRLMDVQGVENQLTTPTG